MAQILTMYMRQVRFWEKPRKPKFRVWPFDFGSVSVFKNQNQTKIQFPNCTPVSDIASRRHLHSSSRHHLTVPRHRLSTFGRRAFSVAGPTVWNSLPDSLRDPALSSDRFRQLLKTNLFWRYHTAQQRCLIAVHLHWPFLEWEMTRALARADPSL